MDEGAGSAAGAAGVAAAGAAGVAAAGAAGSVAARGQNEHQRRKQEGCESQSSGQAHGAFLVAPLAPLQGRKHGAQLDGMQHGETAVVVRFQHANLRHDTEIGLLP